MSENWEDRHGIEGRPDTSMNFLIGFVLVIYSVFAFIAWYAWHYVLPVLL